MGTTKHSEKRQQTAVNAFRLLPEQQEKLDSLAVSHKLTPGQYAKILVVEAIESEKPRMQNKVKPVNAAEFAAAMATFNKAGELLNRIDRALNGIMPVTQKEMQEAKREIVAATRALRAVILNERGNA